ncbi:hypothetical protein LCGC14_1047880 [marine sediment metagenome]|uniref:Bulb-type lectin domain-containing protein n=2 Tax=root TaxID=1 RepID=A0A831QVT7_9FLAO|nr:hypothetical protein [Pricia sp.]HEA23512.1 hypothetical protein [Pricia antarctica]
MKIILCIVTVVLLLSCTKDRDDLLDQSSTQFQGKVAWIKNFGGSGDDTAQAIVSTSDGGFAVLGFSNSIDGDLTGKTTEVNDYWLLKLDSDGNVEWNKTYGGSKDDRGQSLVHTNDGGYAITGYAMSDDGDGSNNEGFHDNWIVKLDVAGNIEWEKSFGFSGHDHSYDIIQTDDNGFFFVGFLDITSARADGNTEKGGGSLTAHGVGEFWGTKIDPTGDLQWRGYFGGTNNDRAHAVVPSEDGGFVLSGFTESDDYDISDTRGSYDFWMVKVDRNGNLLWESSFGGTGIEISQDIANTADGGYVVVGHTFSNDIDVSKNNGESDMWLVKTDSIGSIVWEKTYGGALFDAAQAVIASKDGGFVVVGNSKSSDIDVESNAGENDMWAIKTDQNGEIVWQKTFGGSGIDFGFDVIETGSGAIILVGETASDDFPYILNRGKTDAVMIKIK